MCATNYEHITKTIESIDVSLRNVIKTKDIEYGKKLYLVKTTYKDIPWQMKSHILTRIPEIKNNAIIHELDDDFELRLFLCVDIQNLILNILPNYQKFNRFFKNSTVSKYILEKFYVRWFQKTETSPTLKILLFFGFVNPSIKTNELDISEEEVLLYEILSQYYLKSIKRLAPRNYFISFDKNILKPVIKFFLLLGLSDKYVTDKKSYIKLNKPEIEEKLIQDTFSCMQYHTFFEDYVNSHLSRSGQVLDNPLILLNPIVRKPYNYEFTTNNILEGYIELDGSLFIGKNNQLILVECKNSKMITHGHVHEFLGKVTFVEKIYGIKIIKILFSTGLRHHIWNKLENYPEMNDIHIFDIWDFRNNFRRLKDILN